MKDAYFSMTEASYVAPFFKYTLLHWATLAHSVPFRHTVLEYNDSAWVKVETKQENIAGVKLIGFDYIKEGSGSIVP